MRALIILGLFSLPAVVSAQSDGGTPPIPEAGIDQKLGQTIPLDLKFRDERGQPVSMKQYFDGKPVILTLVYYRCPRLCSMVLNHLNEGLKKIDYQIGQDFQLVTVSFDPREGPELAAAKKAAYVEEYDRPGAKAGWHFLTGDDQSIKALAEAVGFRYRFDAARDQFAHVSAVMVLTPDGQMARYLFGLDYPPRDLRFALEDASANKIGSPLSRPLRLLCFAYDADSGRYSFAILRILRWVSGFTVLCLACFLWKMRRQEKSCQEREPSPC